jgi:anti-anti-sigma regulatory factor
MDSSGEMAVRIEDTDIRRVLHVEGPLDLSSAPVLLQALRSAMGFAGESGRGTMVDLAGITAVDLCGLQLLCSAHRTFLACGGEIGVRDVPVWFHLAATAAGFTMGTLECRYRSCDRCLWRE